MVSQHRMPTWNAGQYLKFGDERTRPCHDLAARVELETPRRIIDLGCGPGNSAAVIAERWPRASLTGLDSSPEMIQTARLEYPQYEWLVGDIGQWAQSQASFDLVFSNAALQWVTNHEAVYPRLLERTAPGGALAFQVPANLDAPAHRLMRDLAASTSWRGRFPAGGVREWFIHDAGFYYDLLAPRCARLDIWETEYMHVLGGPEAIVEWYKGTGLRPFLDVLDEPDRRHFAADYLQLIRDSYPVRPDGRVLFPFRRLFVIAYRA